MATLIIGDKLEQIEKYNWGYLNNLVGGLMRITAQTSYDLQKLTMHLMGI